MLNQLFVFSLCPVCPRSVWRLVSRGYRLAEHVDIEEAKSIFETNYSHVYYVLYDTFITAEGNLRQKGKRTQHRLGRIHTLSHIRTYTCS